MVSSGSQWLPVVVNNNGSQWFTMATCNFQWFSMVTVVLNGFQWFSTVSSGSQWQSVIPVDLDGFRWLLKGFPVVLNGNQ